MTPIPKRNKIDSNSESQQTKNQTEPTDPYLITAKKITEAFVFPFSAYIFSNLSQAFLTPYSNTASQNNREIDSSHLVKSVKPLDFQGEEQNKNHSVSRDIEPKVASWGEKTKKKHRNRREKKQRTRENRQIENNQEELLQIRRGINREPTRQSKIDPEQQKSAAPSLHRVSFHPNGGSYSGATSRSHPFLEPSPHIENDGPAIASLAQYQKSLELKREKFEGTGSIRIIDFLKHLNQKQS